MLIYSYFQISIHLHGIYNRCSVPTCIFFFFFRKQDRNPNWNVECPETRSRQDSNHGRYIQLKVDVIYRLKLFTPLDRLHPGWRLDCLYGIESSLEGLNRSDLCCPIWKSVPVLYCAREEGHLVYRDVGEWNKESL